MDFEKQPVHTIGADSMGQFVKRNKPPKFKAYITNGKLEPLVFETETGLSEDNIYKLMRKAEAFVKKNI